MVLLLGIVFGSLRFVYAFVIFIVLLYLVIFMSALTFSAEDLSFCLANTLFKFCTNAQKFLLVLLFPAGLFVLRGFLHFLFCFAFVWLCLDLLCYRYCFLYKGCLHSLG